MSILTVENLSQGFGGRQILSEVSFRLLAEEHVGLVGANGEGKSTFLNLITGHLQPEEGKIEWCNQITMGYIDQETLLEEGKTIFETLKEAFSPLVALEETMLSLYEAMADCDPASYETMAQQVSEITNRLEMSEYYTIESKIEEVANGIGLGEIGLEKKVDELSGGQRMKVLLVKLLLENPMILILDEPTNFLDEQHIRWLTQFLTNYPYAFILVSHDIPFLNAVTNVIYHIENAELTRYKGDYQYFLEMYELKKKQHESAYEKQQKEIQKMETFISKNKARVATSNMAKSRMKQLDKMVKLEKQQEKVKPSFGFSTARTPGRVILQATDLVLGYNTALTRPMQLLIERNQKIAIKGVNGLGKSTLLNTLLGNIPSISGDIERDQFLEVGYFQQESKQNSNTALQEIWNAYPSMSNGEVRAALARCGLTNEHIISQMKVLSGGENTKVRLCHLMLQSINFLVLDEPTNHLDVEAKEELKRAISAFQGTVLLVSHEPEFYENIVTDVWNLEQWTTKII